MLLCLNSWAVLINHLGSLVESEPYSMCSLWTICPDYFCPWVHLLYSENCIPFMTKSHKIPLFCPLTLFKLIQVHLSFYHFSSPLLPKKKTISKALAPVKTSSQNAWLCAEIAFEIHYIKHKYLFFCNESVLCHAQSYRFSCASFLTEYCHSHLLGKKGIKTIKGWDIFSVQMRKLNILFEVQIKQ